MMSAANELIVNTLASNLTISKKFEGILRYYSKEKQHKTEKRY